MLAIQGTLKYTDDGIHIEKMHCSFRRYGKILIWYSTALPNPAVKRLVYYLWQWNWIWKQGLHDQYKHACFPLSAKCTLCTASAGIGPKWLMSHISCSPASCTCHVFSPCWKLLMLESFPKGFVCMMPHEVCIAFLQFLHRYFLHVVPFKVPFSICCPHLHDPHTFKYRSKLNPGQKWMRGPMQI